jgi:hypothetical protein
MSASDVEIFLSAPAASAKMLHSAEFDPLQRRRHNNGGAAHSFALLLCGDEIFPRSLQSTSFEYYSAPVEIEVKNAIQTDCHVCNFSNWEGVCACFIRWTI